MIRQQSDNNSIVFRNFNIYYDKVATILLWLKINNHYYKDIIINNEILQFLSKNKSIISQLMQIQDEITEETLGNKENENKSISHLFVPFFLSTYHEDIAINNILNHIL